MFTRLTRGALAAAAAAALLLGAVLAAPAPAHARVDRLAVVGLGTASVPVEGPATFSGYLNGTPISGTYVGRLDAADGSLPELGNCETATVRLGGRDPRGHYVVLRARDGRVCSLLLPLGTMQAFDGSFDVVATNDRRLRRVHGVVQVRLLGDLSDIYAIGG